MLIKLSVLDAHEKLIKKSTIDTTLSLSLLEQIEEISQFLKWKTLRVFEWRTGKILQTSTVFRAQGENRKQDYPHLSAQLEYIKLNYAARLKEHNIDFYTLELQEKSQHELEMEYKHTDGQFQINPYLLKL